MKESINEELAKETTRLAYIKSEDKKFHECSKSEIDNFLKTL